MPLASKSILDQLYDEYEMTEAPKEDRSILDQLYDQHEATSTQKNSRSVLDQLYDEYEKSTKEPEEETGLMGTVGRGIAMGTAGMAQGVGSATRWAGEAIGSKPIAEAGKTASTYWKEASQNIAPKGEAFEGTFVENPSVKKAALLISQAAPSIGVALTAGAIAGPVAAAAGLGLLEGAPQYEEAREAGKSVAEASGTGIMSTAGTALLEYLPIAKFLKGFKGGVITRAGKGLVTEGSQEASQQLWQNLVEKYGYNKTKDLSEGLVESAIGGGGTGAIAGTIFKSIEPNDLDKAKKDIDNQIIGTANSIAKTSPSKNQTPPIESFREKLTNGQMTEADLLAAKGIWGSDPEFVAGIDSILAAKTAPKKVVGEGGEKAFANAFEFEAKQKARKEAEEKSKQQKDEDFGAFFLKGYTDEQLEKIAQGPEPAYSDRPTAATPEMARRELERRNKPQPTDRAVEPVVPPKPADQIAREQRQEQINKGFPIEPEGLIAKPEAEMDAVLSGKLKNPLDSKSPQKTPSPVSSAGTSEASSQVSTWRDIDPKEEVMAGKFDQGDRVIINGEEHVVNEKGSKVEFNDHEKITKDADELITGVSSVQKAPTTLKTLTDEETKKYKEIAEANNATFQGIAGDTGQIQIIANDTKGNISVTSPDEIAPKLEALRGKTPKVLGEEASRHTMTIEEIDEYPDYVKSIQLVKEAQGKGERTFVYPDENMTYTSGKTAPEGVKYFEVSPDGRVEVVTPKALGEAKPAKEPFRMTKDEFASIGLKNNYWEKNGKWFTAVEGKEVEVSAKEINRLKEEVFSGSHKLRVKDAIAKGDITADEAISLHKSSYPDIETFPPEMKAEVPKFETSEDAQKAIDAEYDRLLEMGYTLEQVDNALLNLDHESEGLHWETIVKNEDVARLNDLYKAIQKIDKVDLLTWREAVVKNSGLEAKEVEGALEELASDVTSTADFLRSWGTQTTSNLSRIYTYFAKPRDIYTNTHGEFRWGGTGDNPVLEGTAYDSDLIRVPFDKEALKKTEKIYNAIAETQGLEPISLSKIEKQQSPSKTKQIESDIETWPEMKAEAKGDAQTETPLSWGTRVKTDRGAIVDMRPEVNAGDYVLGERYIPERQSMERSFGRVKKVGKQWLDVETPDGQTLRLNSKIGVYKDAEAAQAEKVFVKMAEAKDEATTKSTPASVPKETASDAPTIEKKPEEGKGKGEIQRQETIKTLSRMAADFAGTRGDERGTLGDDTAHKIGSSLPEWFQTLNARIRNDKSTPNINGISRDNFLAVLNNLQNGKKLTDKQFDLYFYMREAIPDYLEQSGESKAESDLSFMEEKGYEPLGGKDIIAGDLNIGDKIYKRGEEFEAKKYDDDGNLILEDGIPIKVDTFDVIENVEGIKKAPEKAEPADQEIKEWQDIKDLDAQIRTIEKPNKDFNEWTVEIGVQESLGEKGGDILTEFYTEKPTIKDIRDTILEHYKDEKIKINEEMSFGIVAKTGRDEIIEEAIDKVLTPENNRELRDKLFIQDKAKDIIKSLAEEEGSLALSDVDRKQSIDWLKRESVYKNLTGEQKKYADTLQDIETISPDGTTVNWDKIETKVKDGIKGTYYATYNKDGSFKKWYTKTEIERLKKLKGAKGLNLKQDTYGKQTGITGKETKGKQAGLGLVVEDPNQPGMFSVQEGQDELRRTETENGAKGNAGGTREQSDDGVSYPGGLQSGRDADEGMRGTNEGAGRSKREGGVLASAAATQGQVDKTGKPAIIVPKGEQNGTERQPRTDNQGRNARRDSVLPEVREEHKRRVGAARQSILAKDDSPPRLKKAIQDGKGLIHYPEGYDNPEYQEASGIASSFGVELIPVTDTSNQTNGFIKDSTIFINMGTREASIPILQTVLHELSHFNGNTATQKKIDPQSNAFRQYLTSLSRSFGRTLSASYVLEEYAADLESGIENRYGATLKSGLKKGESVETIKDKIAGRADTQINEFSQPAKFSLKEAVKKITDNPKFVKWFGKSQVINPDGSPMVVYHGTPNKEIENGIFENRKTDYQGFWFTKSQRYAKHYEHGVGHTEAVYLKLENPLNLDTKKSYEITKGLADAARKNNTSWMEEAKKAGYDGTIMFGGLSKGRGGEIHVFEPTQIKSIFNTEFDPTNPDIRYQTAFHGTPHVWQPEKGFPHGRPRLDMIGTGEGAAAYGWGWYSADVQDTATSYNQAGHGMGWEIDGKLYHGYTTKNDAKAENYAANALDHVDGDIDEAIGWLEKFGREGEARDFLLEMKKKGVTIKKAEGSLYKLDIPDDVTPKLLDWDKPVDTSIKQKIRADLPANKIPDTAIKAVDTAGYFSFRDALINDKVKFSGEDLYSELVSIYGSKKAASEYLASIGIPGNKYLDQMSRDRNEWIAKHPNGGENVFQNEKSAKEFIKRNPEYSLTAPKQTSNYVIWDQKVLDRIALLERNGEKLDAIRESEEIKYSLQDTEQARTEYLKKHFPEMAKSLHKITNDSDVVTDVLAAKEAMKWTKTAKKDLNFFDTNISTAEFYAEKDPTYKRYMEVIFNASTKFYEMQNQILGTFQDNSKVLKKEDKQFGTKKYERIMDYADSTDRFISGYSIQEVTSPLGTSWGVYGKPVIGTAKNLAEATKMAEGNKDAYVAPSGKGYLVLGKRDLVAEFNTEQEAVESMIDYEVEDYVKEHRDVSDAEIDTLRDVRKATNEQFNLLFAQMRRLIAEAKAKNEAEIMVTVSVETKEDGTVEPIRKPLSWIMAEMGNLRGSYMPRIRPRGAYVLIAKKSETDKFREHFDLPATNEGSIADMVGKHLIPMRRRAEELKRQHYTVTYEKSKVMPETLFESAKLVAATDAMIKAGIDKLDDSKASQALKTELSNLLTEAMSNLFQGRGFRSQMIKRTGEIGDAVWKGYEVDLDKRIVGSANSVAAGIAKRDKALGMMMTIMGKDISWEQFQEENPGKEYKDFEKMVEERRIDPINQKVMYADIMDHAKEVLRNDEAIDRVVGTAKGIASVWFLGFRVSSTAVNFTNIAILVPAAMHAIGKIAYNKTFGLIGSGLKTYADYRLGRPVSEQNRMVLTEIRKRGWDAPLFNQDAYEALLNKTQGTMNWWVSKAMWMFGKVEELLRGATILASYNGLPGESPKGYIGEDRLLKAKHISDRAHGIYSKATRPAITRGTGLLPAVARAAVTFTKYPHTYLLDLLQFAKDEKSAKAVAHMLLAPAIIGGLGASVGTSVIAGIAKALGFGGDDPEEEWYKYAEEEFGAGKWLRHGLAGLGGYGVNIKGSLSIGLKSFNSLESILGAPYAVPSNIVKGISLAAKGEFAKGAEKALPLFMSTPIRGIREATKGVTTGSNVPVFYGQKPVIGTPLEAMWSFFAFNPSRTSAIKEELWKERNVEKEFSDQKSDLYRKYRHMWKEGITAEKLGELTKETEIFNEQIDKIKESGYFGVTPITAKSLKVQRRKMLKPPKKEKERARFMDEEIESEPARFKPIKLTGGLKGINLRKAYQLKGEQ